jgi:multicomponent Na+:H+ antiporter subunit A
VLIAILTLLALSALAPLLERVLRRHSYQVLALGPLAVFVSLAGGFLPLGRTENWAWFPSLGVGLDFHLTGLGRLMGLLICGIGVLVLLYARSYLDGERLTGRFGCFLMLFMAAMLGVVLADNLILLFIFWELTSISSYLLIGYFHESEESRWKALQALLVTGFGGVAMLGGFILLGLATDAWTISGLRATDVVIIDHPWYPAILTLVLLGALTKSAQFPFHFWLPNAMAAPTPVSAYLHSATMVKAGIFLLATMHPILGRTDAWAFTLVPIGGLTAALAAYKGFLQTDLKSILAYSTLSVLGILTLMLGVGTDLALKSAVLFMLGHALYKAALFMVAGSIDHETGTRDVRVLGSLRSLMPMTAAGALLASFSKAGFPPFFGFVGKEYVYKTATQLDEYALLVLLPATVANMLLLALALKVGLHPFWSRADVARLPKKPHEAPWTMWIGPLALGAAGLVMGLQPHRLVTPLVQPAVQEMAGHPVSFALALWHGFNLPLMLSVLTVTCGLTLYFFRRRAWAIFARIKPNRFTFDLAYKTAFDRFFADAKTVTGLLQSGSLRQYFMVILMFTGGLLIYELFLLGDVPLNAGLAGLSLVQGACGLLAVGGTWVAVTSTSRTTVLAGLGLVGFAVGTIFLFQAAPDLAITQILVEALTVVLFMLVLSRLPKIRFHRPARTRMLDAAVAMFAGVIVTVLVLKAQAIEIAGPISGAFGDLSYLQAKGKNVVNVILVDFRALDTLGEATVLGIAALGIKALLCVPRAGGGRSYADSLIFRTTARALMPILVGLSLVVLYRGHNQPGGGFIGGLLAAIAVILMSLAFSSRTARMSMRIAPGTLIGVGLAVVLVSGLLGMFSQTFLTGLWLPAFELPLLGKVHLGTPVLFDIGVYLAVIGFVTQTTFSLTEENA